MAKPSGMGIHGSRRGRPPGSFGTPDPEPVESDEWGSSAEEVPAFVPVALEQPSEPSEALKSLGDPPADARGGQAWAYKALMIQAREVMVDNTISEATRRKEVRTILAAAARHYPDAVKFDDAEAVRRADERVSKRKRGRAAAKLEERPSAGAAKVIPIRRG